MLTLAENEVLDRIQRLEPFEAMLEDGSLTIRISDYQPMVATAIHQGERVRPELEAKCALTKSERFYEEDPCTNDFISSLPITLVGRDSRYEYDLNRGPETCIYEDAWGKSVWTEDLTDEERAVSLAKHATYYRIFNKLVETIERSFGLCVVYDLHSYNYQRIERETPTFNLGTKQVNRRRWQRETDALLQGLASIELPNLDVGVAENDVFGGMGYQATFVKANFTNTLILPLEVKKVYMDETKGEIYPLVVSAMKEGLKKVLTEHAAETVRRRTKRKVRATHMLPSALSDSVIKVDRELARLSQNLETLQYINPTNLAAEKRRFFARKGNYEPVFRYRQLAIDPYSFRQRLYRLPVAEIRDADVEQLYCQVIDTMAKRIDLLTSIGTDNFLYNSLRYYGQPDKKDLDNARFIMHAPEYTSYGERNLIAAQAVEIFERALSNYPGMRCKVQATAKLAARAMVSGAKKTILINAAEKFSEEDLNALIHHELGVHMVTSANAARQPLKVLKLGLPGNTHTQEGLAILCEYLSGCFSLPRLKTLGLRVEAVDKMVAGESFAEIYHHLIEECNADAETAFTVTSRVCRGGGFTKDYLYLRGLKDALRFHQQGDLDSLFIGKTGFDFKPLLDELIARGILEKPHYLPQALKIERPADPVMDYLVTAIH